MVVPSLRIQRQPGTGIPSGAGTATRSWSRRPGFRDDLWIDTGGSPMSDVAKMTERIRRPNYGMLDIELTIDDPKNYGKPFTVNLSQHLELDTGARGRVLPREREVVRPHAAIPRQVGGSEGGSPRATSGAFCAAGAET